MERIAALDPLDQHNRLLQSQVRPQDWSNPQPSGRYNLVVVGAGTAGLVTAAGAAGLGAKVALVERELMGGDCLNVGCVPSKAIISSARVAAAVQNADSFGVRVADSTVDFSAVMERMRRVRAGISHVDSAARFRDLGVDVFLGSGRFTSSDTIDVDGRVLRFRRAVVATGARATAPPISGLESVDYLTNETLFSLTELPRRIAVVGAGPIGCEMAQTFARFGSEVFLIEAAHGVLPREDPDASEIVKSALLHDGVKLLCCGKTLNLARSADGTRIMLSSHEQDFEVFVDEILVSAGRKPNVTGLGLETVGVKFDERTGIDVDDHLRTTNPRIFAAGDVCSKYQFTHAADFMARIVIQNSLFPFPKARFSRLVVPWCTYTSPELAHVGLSESDAKAQSIAVDTYTQQLAHVDRAILEGETEGFVKVLTAAGTDRILGGTIVAPHAGDMIAEVTLAMKYGLGLGKIGSVIHSYPTQAEAIRKLGDQFNKTRLTPQKARLLQRFLRWRL